MIPLKNLRTTTKFVRGYKVSYLERLRREKNKKDLLPAVDIDNAYLLQYPNQRLGNNYELNFKLVRYGVAPSGNAFRNLHTRHLAMYTEGKTDNTKAIHSIGSNGAGHQTYFANTPPSTFSFSSGNQINSESWDKIISAVTRHMCFSENLFLTDAATGSHRNAQTSFRILSESANASLYLKNLLVKAAGDLEQFKHDFFVYHVPSLKLKNPANYGIKSDGSFSVFALLKGESVLDTLTADQLKQIPDEQKNILANKEAGILVVAGTPSLAVLRDAILSASDYVNLRNGRLPLSASTITNKNKSALVFDPSSVLLTGRVHPYLFSASGSVLTQTGLYRTLDGVSHHNVNSSKKIGDYIDSVGDVQTLTQPLSRYNKTELHAPSPSSVVFLVKDESKSGVSVKSLSADDAAKQFKDGFNGQANTPSYVNRTLLEPESGSLNNHFGNYVKESKVPVFVVNVGKGMKNQDLDSILDSILEGKAPKTSA
eukprot:TRINITY_DN3301_c0_g1_i1.p1 TRINITY_DN3301_c0_g1~~TRINITY_DN3301_c0_g1_i1.p1  ORF type:complete len:484 (+),score=105.67 TRINITY_DN3301_c0_g1_i1:23-1474(+)